VLAVPSRDGKLTPALIEPVLAEHSDHHMVKPRLVYISNVTELGTVYSAKELAELSNFCRQHDLLLYLDGARLGAALAAQGSDLRLADVARYTDAFTIGGAKNGALIGEAIVLKNPLFQTDFIFHIKQRGGLLAKGRLLGLQFKALFTDNLFYQNAHHANLMAGYLKEGIKERGYRFFIETHANMLFAIFPTNVADYLLQNYQCAVWHKTDTETCLRLVTSWATEIDAVEQFLADLPPAGQALNSSFRHKQSVITPPSKPSGRAKTVAISRSAQRKTPKNLTTK
jgi:threonine aldolase